MRPSTYARVSLLIPLPVIAVVMAPILVAPFMWEVRSVRAALEAEAMLGTLGLSIGYVCVALAFLGWPRE